MEEAFRKRLRKQREHESKNFDIALSGTSATLVIQLPKKLIVAWVGNSMVAI